MDFQVLKTNRLILREMTENDFEFLLKLETRPENKKYEMEGIQDRDSIIKECQWYLEEVNNLPKSGAIKFIVLIEDTRIGFVSLKCNWEEVQEWEIGYSFLREYWGNGYASESTKRVIDFAFKDLLIHKLVAFINSENTASVSLTKRLGMVQEGYLREVRMINGKWNDEYVFALLKSDL